MVIPSLRDVMRYYDLFDDLGLHGRGLMMEGSVPLMLCMVCAERMSGFAGTEGGRERERECVCALGVYATGHATHYLSIRVI